MDELHQLAMPAQEKMRRHPQASQPSKVRMRRDIQTIGEQGLHRVTCEMLGRQADVMEDDRIDDDALGPRIMVGAVDHLHVRQPGRSGVHQIPSRCSR